MSGGITAVAPATGEYFHASKVISEAVQSGQALRRRLIPIRLVVWKKDPMLEEELLARVLECIFFLISFTLYDFRMGRQTPLQPHHPPSACGVRARRHFEDAEEGLWKGGEGVREGEGTCIVD